jgi:hypothetical protein
VTKHVAVQSMNGEQDMPDAPICSGVAHATLMV